MANLVVPAQYSNERFNKKRAGWQKPNWTLERLEERTLLAGDSLAPFGFGSLAVDTSTYDARKVLLQLQPDARIEEVSSILPGTKLKGSGDLAPGLYEAYLAEDVSVNAALAAFGTSSAVAFVEPDYRVKLGATLFPSDSSFVSLWGLNNTGQSGGTVDADIDAPEAWSITTGSRSTIVAVIDTGVDYTHPDLAANMWINSDEIAGNRIDDDGNGYVDDVYGYDFANNDGNPMDDAGHGTHVAGTIGAVGNNGRGIVGINWQVQIMALKFLDANGSGFTSDAVRALDYAVANGAKISNASWGGGGFSNSLFNAIQRGRNAGHIFVAAAGNESTNNDSRPSYPANYNLDNVISVAATDRNDRLASFSNYGATTVHLGAPGVSILSTTPGNTYSTYSGTSMATPHVTGVVALVHSQHPEWSYSQTIAQVLNTADPIASLQGKTVTGKRLNAAAAVASGSSADLQGPSVMASIPSGTASAPVSRVRITFNEPINPTSFTLADIRTFSGPGGSIPVTAVSAIAGTNNREFDISFAPQSAPGSYTMIIGPQVSDAAGNLMDQDRDGRAGESTEDQHRVSFTLVNAQTFPSVNVPLPVRDLSTVTSTLSVNQSAVIADLDVQLDIAHTWDGDLRIFLQSPSGTLVTLSQYRGGSGDHYQGTIFDDEAALPISSGSAPFSGRFRPDEPLSAFDGQAAQGTWTLFIHDAYDFDQGQLTGWSLIIEPKAVNRAPQLGMVGDRTMTTGQDVLAIPLSAVDPDGDALTFTAGILSSAGPFAGKAFELDQQLGLYHTGHDYLNWGGWREKWLRSASNGSWYFITPDGSFYRWNGSRNLVGSQLVATLNGSYHADLAKLHTARDPRSAAEIAYELDQKLDLRFTGNYYENWGGRGEKWLRSGDSVWYFITPDGSVYRWNGQRDLTTSLWQATLDSTFHADPSKLYEARPPVPVSNLNGSTVRVVDNQLLVDPAVGFVGDLRISVSVTDGQTSGTETFSVTVLPGSNGSTAKRSKARDSVVDVRRTRVDAIPVRFQLLSHGTSDAQTSELIDSTVFVIEPSRRAALSSVESVAYVANPLQRDSFNNQFVGYQNRMDRLDEVLAEVEQLLSFGQIDALDEVDLWYLSLCCQCEQPF